MINNNNNNKDNNNNNNSASEVKQTNGRNLYVLYIAMSSKF